jgi:hypothetical protein
MYGVSPSQEFAVDCLADGAGRASQGNAWSGMLGRSRHAWRWFLATLDSHKK